MKIAFVNEGVYEYAIGAPDGVGGIERDLWLLARTLAAAGCSPVVGVREGLGACEQRVIDGVKYVGLPPGQVLWGWHRLLMAEKPHWLFWEGATHLLGPLIEIARLAGARTIFHTAFDADVDPRHALFLRARWWPLYAWGLFRTDVIFVQHTGQLSRLPLQWQSKAFVLPKVCNPSNGLSESVDIKPHSMRDRYVAWVAMLRQPKRPDLLIDIARKAPHMTFVVCGGVTAHRCPPGYGDTMVEAFRQLPNIVYRGQIPAPEAAQVIADAAVLLSTSDEEGFPNTFIQAWSSGTPVVSLKVDPDRIIRANGLGCVSGTVENAISDLNALLASPEMRERIATRARIYVAEVHSEAAVTEVFERALNGHRRSR